MYDMYFLERDKIFLISLRIRNYANFHATCSFMHKTESENLINTTETCTLLHVSSHFFRIWRNCNDVHGTSFEMIKCTAHLYQKQSAKLQATIINIKRMN